MLSAFAGFSCGPLVRARHLGFEQTFPTRVARTLLTGSEKSSAIGSDLPLQRNQDICRKLGGLSGAQIEGMDTAESKPQTSIASAKYDLVCHRIEDCKVTQNIVIDAPPDANHVPLNQRALLAICGESWPSDH